MQLRIAREERERDEIGATGFEPATARPPAECATRLRHAPKRATGLEPALRAWKALVQPLHHTRAHQQSKASRALRRGPGPRAAGRRRPAQPNSSPARALAA